MTTGDPWSGSPRSLPEGEAEAHRGLGADAELIRPEDLDSWVIGELSGETLAFNKPGWVVCHPSKQGPWSSLVGAARLHYRLERIHLVSRLDRETSGLVLLARNRRMSSHLQRALEARQVRKSYLAILQGDLSTAIRVDRPIGPDSESPVHVKQTACGSGRRQTASTRFRPLTGNGTFTLAEVETETGRKHQIRVHAQWAGFPVAGDKLYGPDETLYLEFVEQGWTPRLEAALPLRRQALHAWRMEFPALEGSPDAPTLSFEAPLAEDLKAFLCEQKIDLPADLAFSGPRLAPDRSPPP